MFEKLEEEIEVKADEYALEESTACNYGESSKHVYKGYFYGFKKGAEFGYNKAKEEKQEQIEKMKWHKLDWDKAEESPDVDKLVRVRTKSGEEYICQTYLYYPTEDEIGYGSTITQFEELNGDWIDDNEIEYWCYIEPFKEIKEND